MNFMSETLKAWMRVVFLIGLMISIDAIVTPGNQPLETAIGSILSTIGIYLGWFDFKSDPE